MAQELERPTTDLTTGIRTFHESDRTPHMFRVSWIDWDSPFRATDLRIGDAIVGIDGQPYDDFLKHYDLSYAIGQYQEKAYWEKTGAAEGRVVRVGVVRDDKVVEIAGALRATRFYYDAAGQSALAPGGPQRRVKDGFDELWSDWYEDRFVKSVSDRLEGGWDRRSFDSRNELKHMLEHKERVDYLQAHHRGPFSDTVLKDWTTCCEFLNGKRVELGPKELAYRDIGPQRIAIAKEEADRALASFKLENKDAVIATFPAVAVDKGENAAGKIVELPWVTFRDMVKILGRVYIIAGDRERGCYFVDVGGEDMQRFFGTWNDFRGQVNPNLKERLLVYGRILNEPRMLTSARAPLVGLLVEPIAVVAGDGELFVDLRGKEPIPPYAGEQRLEKFSALDIPDDASPTQVMGALIEAIKQANSDAYRSLFAHWQLTWIAGHRAVNLGYSPAPPVLADNWERARRSIVGPVYDARVGYTSAVRIALERETAQGRPQVEEMDVYVDHYGLFDGEYRQYRAITVNRHWVLQRIESGPWRIVSAQPL